MTGPDTSGSEFGRGVVVCLAKFSEHLQDHGPFGERAVRELATWTEDERRRCLAEAQQFPYGDAAQKLARVVGLEMGLGGIEDQISNAIELWMNAASDHFYDLDKDKAPAPLCGLAELTLRIGHGFTGERWTLETIDRIRQLWRESCLAIDCQLGTDPDWGTW